VSSVVALDHGTRRIGLAVADLETGMAFARPAIRRTNLEADLALIRAVCDAEQAARVVIGLPRNMDGSEGPQAATVRAFGQRLAELGLEVVYEDERLTSWEAGERMGEAGRRVRRATGELDSTAARLILQQYLDARYRAGRPAEESE
jgi:putative Holliday junction resolvase